VKENILIARWTTTRNDFLEINPIRKEMQ
jgi:hypothetical protein